MTIEILKFYTDTCTPCKVVGKILDKIEGIRVTPINAIEDKDMSAKYEVYATPTLVFKDGDKIVGRIQGMTTESKIRELLSECNAN